MRTWFNFPAARAPCAGGVPSGPCPGQPDDKKRVPVPAFAGSPHALAKETGCPVGIIARRTAAPLA